MDLIRHFWENLTAPMLGPITAMMVQMSTGLLAYIHRNLHWALIISMAIGVVFAALRHEDLFPSLLQRLIPAIVFVTTVLSVPFYNTMFIQLATHLPASLIAAANGQPQDANIFAAIDTAQMKSLLGPANFLKGMTISVWTPTSLLVALMVAFEMIATVIAYGVMAVCELLLLLAQSLTISFGPCALVFGIWARTRGIMAAWLGVIATTITSQVLLAMVITLIIGAQDKLAFAMLNMPQSGAAAFGIELASLAIAIAVYLLMPMLALFVVPLSGRIFSGVTAGIGGLIGVPGRVAGSAFQSAAPSGGGGSAGPSFSGTASAASNPMPGRPVGRGP